MNNAGTETIATFDANEPHWRHCFISSTLPWMSDDNPDTGTVEIIVTKFEAIADTSPSLLHPRAPGFGPLQWRIGTLNDFRNMRVRAAGERLTRWEISRPREVFKYGIISLAERLSLTDPAYVVSNADGLAHPIANLRAYVRNGRPSVFVSTSRTGRDPQGLIHHVVPQNVAVVNNRYEYEIFVHGGIDVEHSGESGNNFNDAGEEEIALSGGIRPEFIRSARKYRGNLGVGEVPKIWQNPFFNPFATELDGLFQVTDLPAIVDADLGVRVRQWPRPPPGVNDDWDEFSVDSDDFDEDPHSPA